MFKPLKKHDSGIDTNGMSTYKNSSELVQHPVLWRCDALQVLLRSSCLEESGESR